MKNKFNFLTLTIFSLKKQTFFAKRLSFLTKAGIPLIESMHLLKSQARSKSELKILESLIKDISRGQSLAKSLEPFKNIFGNFSINLIKAGEASGTLTENLQYLSEELRKKEILRKKILSALFYPTLILFATLGIVSLLLIYVFPKILPIFHSLKAELPFSTKVVIFLSETIRHYGIYMLFTTILTFFVFIFSRKYLPKVKLFFDYCLIYLPLFGGINKNYNLANITRTLGLLLKSGFSLTQALSITTETTINAKYHETLQGISREILKGKNLSRLLAEHPRLFPEVMRQMIAVGEGSGHLSGTLIYLSEFYENELDDLTKNLSSSLEPALMILMGLLVGLVAISVITPIYEITNNLKR